MKLIDKDALVAEIRRWLEETDKGFPNDHNLGRFDAYKRTLSFLDNLEVKEADLEKELNDFIEQQKAWIKDDRVVEYNNGDSFNHIYDLEEIAKYFFELGMSVSNKAQKGE